jgi:hypothetical protein
MLWGCHFVVLKIKLGDGAARVIRTGCNNADAEHPKKIRSVTGFVAVSGPHLVDEISK